MIINIVENLSIMEWILYLSIMEWILYGIIILCVITHITFDIIDKIKKNKEKNKK